MAEESRESERRFRLTLDTIMEGCQIIGFDWRCLYINDAAARHGQLAREDVLGKTVMEIYPGIEKTEMFAVLQECMSKRTSHRMRHAFRFPNRTEGWFELSMHPVPEGVFILSLDITERKRAEEELRESEEKYRSIFENVAEGIVKSSLDGDIVVVNPAAASILRYESPAELVKSVRNVAELYVDAGDRQKIRRRLREHGLARDFEARFRRKDGSAAWVRLSLKPIRDSHGGITTFLEIWTDITQSKQAEEALQKSELRFRSVAESTLDAIITINSSGDIVFLNQSAESMFGYSKEEALGKPLALLVPERIRHDLPKRLGLLSSPEQSLYKLGNIEVEGLRKDGSVFPAEVSISAWDAQEGRFFTSVTRDITERKRAEEELKQAQAMLVHSDKMASIGQLAAGVAHEINNPMGFINSNLNTMAEYLGDLKVYIGRCEEALHSIKSRLDGQADLEYQALRQLRESLDLEYVLSDAEKLVRESIDGSQRVKKIVQHLRSFSRTGNNADVQLASVETILDVALNIVWSQLKYTCTVTKDYGKVPEVECNANQLGQVFVNILVNAGQAIGEDRHGEIGIKTYGDDNAVFIEVSDNGVGIPAGQVGKVFDPFFTTKPFGQGTGLGLSISYNIIREHGGQISVRSEAGIGTTFTIQLPVPSRHGKEVEVST